MIDVNALVKYCARYGAEVVQHGKYLTAYCPDECTANECADIFIRHGVLSVESGFGDDYFWAIGEVDE